MNSKNTLSITEARKNIFKILDDVQKPDVYYTLTDKGRPKAVVLSVDYFESLLETIEVLQDFPDLAKDVKEAEAEFTRGEYITLEEILSKEGFVLADKANYKYEASSRHNKKSAKRTK